METAFTTRVYVQHDPTDVCKRMFERDSSIVYSFMVYSDIVETVGNKHIDYLEVIYEVKLQNQGRTLRGYSQNPHRFSLSYRKSFPYLRVPSSGSASNSGSSRIRTRMPACPCTGNRKMMSSFLNSRE